MDLDELRDALNEAGRHGRRRRRYLGARRGRRPGRRRRRRTASSWWPRGRDRAGRRDRCGRRALHATRRLDITRRGSAVTAPCRPAPARRWRTTTRPVQVVAVSAAPWSRAPRHSATIRGSWDGHRLERDASGRVSPSARYGAAMSVRPAITNDVVLFGGTHAWRRDHASSCLMTRGRGTAARGPSDIRSHVSAGVTPVSR